MTDLAALPPVSTADLAQPVTADFYTKHGANPEQAAALAAQHEAMAGRRGYAARAAIAPTFDNMPPPPKVAPDAGMPAIQAQEILAEHESKQTQAHLESLYTPPTSHADYRVPSTVDDVTDEAAAADAAFTQMLHSENAPRDIAEAIMIDLQRNRASEKSAETSAALRPWVTQMIANASKNPALAPYVAGASADQLLALLSPETVVSLAPWLKWRASRGG